VLFRKEKYQGFMPGPRWNAAHTVFEVVVEEEDKSPDEVSDMVTVTVGWTVLLCTTVSAILVIMAWKPRQLTRQESMDGEDGGRVNGQRAFGTGAHVSWEAD
jgi:hypothetical protein